MEKYDILEWVDYFERSKGTVDEKTDFLESNSKILYPGRFYVLNYFAKTKERYNTRPVIISLGTNQVEKDKFICIDLTVIPKKIRLQFVDMFFKLYERDINKNIVEHPSVEGADNQSWMRSCTYENLCKMFKGFPIKNIIKKYDLKNTAKIYSLPFSKVYCVVGDYCDENYYVNGTVADIQKEFLKKMTSIK